MRRQPKTGFKARRKMSRRNSEQCSHSRYGYRPPEILFQISFNLSTSMAAQSFVGNFPRPQIITTTTKPICKRLIKCGQINIVGMLSLQKLTPNQLPQLLALFADKVYQIRGCVIPSQGSLVKNMPIKFISSQINNQNICRFRPIYG